MSRCTEREAATQRPTDECYIIQSDVYVVDTLGQLNVFSAVGSGNWSEPQTISPAGLARSGASIAVSQGLGTNDQTDLFVMN